jgi:tyrosyl-tRNA synthetase
VLKRQAYGLLMPLITNEEGNKFGKSAGNAVYLDKDKTSEFAFYQFFLRQPDTEAEKLLKLFSLSPSKEVHDLLEEHKKLPEVRQAQKTLADQLTLLIHGKEGLEKAKRVSEALFGGDINAIGELKNEDVKDVFSGAPFREFIMEPGTTMLEAAMRAECFKNKIDAQRIISAGGFYINMKKTQNPNEILTNSHILPNGISIFRVGKKNYYIIKWV